MLARPREADEAEFVLNVDASADLHEEWVAPPATREDLAAYLRRLRKRDSAGFLVRERITNGICGVINLNNIVRGAFDSAYLGYYAFAVGAGRGYMTEGLQLACTYVFDAMGLHRLAAGPPGATGPAGAVGPAGPMGPAGPAGGGVSHNYWNDSSVSPTSPYRPFGPSDPDFYGKNLSLAPLPAGNYLVTATLQIAHGGSGREGAVYCALTEGVGESAPRVGEP